MNRKKGTALVLSGVAIVLATLVGVFALITDTADTGTLSVESDTQAAAMDLTIHDTELSSASTNCASLAAGGYVDNQTIAPLTIVDADPGTTLTRYVCVKNTGVHNANISLELRNTQNIESFAGCTGDEANTDTNCDNVGDPGELADDVDVTVTKMGPSATSSVGCNETAQAGPISYDGVADSAAQAFSLPIGANEYACYRIVATYDATTSGVEDNENQTDKVSWQFRFHGAIDS